MSAAPLEPGKMGRTFTSVVAVLQRMSQRLEEIKSSRPDNKFAFGYVIADTLTLVQRADGDNLFLEALREYKHSAADRKALEAAIQLTMRRRILQPKTAEAGLQTAEKTLETFARALSIVERVLRQGDVCEKNECKTAGCFRAVNAGGFDAKVMAVAEREVAEAARLVEAAGFSEVCYGGAYVTQRISGSNVLAFWMPSEDRMYIRAKPKRGEESLAVGVVVHELGHRFEAKFLSKPARSLIDTIFRQWSSRFERSGVTGEVKVGDEWKDPKKPITYRVTGFKWGGRSGTEKQVLMEIVGEPGVALRGSEDAVKRALGGGYADDPFPSSYARTEAGEMFAELFRVVVVGGATSEQRAAFKSILQAGRIASSSLSGQAGGFGLRSRKGRRG